MIFGSPTLTGHLGRGLAGLAALKAAIWGFETIGWPALLLLAVMVWCFRGCPICWTLGLFETLALKIHRLAEAEA